MNRGVSRKMDAESEAYVAPPELGILLGWKKPTAYAVG